MKEIKLYKFYRNKYGVEQLCDALEFDAIKSGIVRFPTHRESFYCIILVEEGTTRLRLNGIEKVICPTDVVCGLPGEVWEWEEDPRIKGKVVIFEPDFLLSAVKDPLLLQRPGFLRSTNHSPFISVSEKGFSLIRDIIIEMIEEVASHNKFYDLLRAQLWHLILLIEKEYQQTGHEIKELPVRNYATGFVNLVGAELYRHHDVEYYADRLCITANYLNKISHSSLGVSARAYIQSRIIAEAKNLIDITTMNISQVANTLGFETANYFIRFFKKQTGVTPGEYRTKIQ
ncbi:MAG: AraC family transcriptional regulator [Bacteroides sp.]|nr:AraC family transcriptional regulator [Bacteroides sp.]MCM1391087.1 AraC family transcriptional regulator [Bacteroides sp.]